MKPELNYRIMTTVAEMIEVEELQRIVWADKNISPVTQLIAAVHNGGVVIAAFHEDRPVGFCYGFAGFKDGKAHLCSHMLGIVPEYRDWGIGEKLKWEQRKWAIAYGYDKMTWTYDPLETRNANLNLNKLGGSVRTYIEAYYGEMNDGINAGMPTDRFLLEWDLQAKRVANREQGISNERSEWSEYPRMLDWELFQEQPRPVARQALTDTAGILLSVPANIQAMKQEHLQLAKEWRFALRKACQTAFSEGYEVVGLLKSDQPAHAYVLKRSPKGE